MAKIGRAGIQNTLAYSVVYFIQHQNNFSGLMRQLTGLFLGAGASYEAGMPLVWELTRELKRWLTPEKLRELNQGWRKQGGGKPDEVIESFIGVLVRPDLHYEALLGYLETQYQRHQTYQQEFHGLYSWLVEMIYHLLYFRHVKNSTFFDGNLPLYAGIRTLAEKNAPLWIFSLNHDLIVEALAAKFEIPLHSGFSNKIISLPRRDKSGKKIGDLRAQVLSEEELKGAFYYPNPGERGIYLLKIHGALDVFAYRDGKDLMKLLPNENTVESLLDALRAVNEEVFYPDPRTPNGRVNTINEITYADESGKMQFLRRSLLAGAYKFDKRSSQVLPNVLLTRFATRINSVTKLVCIGYGFADLHINAIIRQWLEFTSTRQLEIVNPGITEIPAFLLHLAPQVEIIPSGATEYFDSIAGIARTRKEKLTKRLAACFRKSDPQQIQQKINLFIKEDLTISINDLLQQLPSSSEELAEKYFPQGDTESAAIWSDMGDDMLERLVEYLEKQ